MKNFFLATAATAAVMAFASPANAALVTSFGPGLATPGAGYTIVNNFNSANAATSVTGTNFQILTPPASSAGSPPANSFPAGTPYLSVLAGGTATYLLGALVGGVQFDWGSIDDFNTFTVNGTLNGQSFTRNFVPGTANFLEPADGNQIAPGTNGRFTVFGNAGEVINSISFASSTNSFEIDNIATTAAVPEPATWAMMVLGFASVGFAMRRRKSVKTTVQFA